MIFASVDFIIFFITVSGNTTQLSTATDHPAAGAPLCAYKESKQDFLKVRVKNSDQIYA